MRNSIQVKWHNEVFFHRSALAIIYNTFLISKDHFIAFPSFYILLLIVQLVTVIFFVLQGMVKGAGSLCVRQSWYTRLATSLYSVVRVDCK